MTHRFVELPGPARGTRLHVAEAGRGEPLLLLHGWPQHWYCWRKVVAELASTRRLIMPDLRGFGWSETPGWGYDAHTFAADALALVDALGIERADVCGHDWGGFAALLLGVEHPERVSRMVVFNSPHPWPPFGGKVLAQLWRTWYVALMASPLGPRLLADGRFIPWFLDLGRRERVFDAAEARIYADRLRQRERAAATSALYRSYLRTARDVFVRRRYDGARLTVPTRLVFGEDDFLVPSASLDGFESHAPGLSVERIAGCGHFLPEERPDVALSHLRGFLRAPTAPPR